MKVLHSCLQNPWKEAGIYLLFTFFGFLVSPYTNIFTSTAASSHVPFVCKVTRTEWVGYLADSDTQPLEFPHVATQYFCQGLSTWFTRAPLLSCKPEPP